MRVALRFLLLFLPVITLALWGSITALDALEEQWLLSDLTKRSRLIAESTSDYLEEALAKGRVTAVGNLLNRMSQDERLTGAMVCGSAGQVLAASAAMPKSFDCSGRASYSLEESSEGTLVDVHGSRLHLARFALAAPGGAELVVIHDTSYMSRRHALTKKYATLLLLGISTLLFVISMIVYRWSMSRSLSRLQAVFKGLVSGDLASVERNRIRGELMPLARDLTKVMRGLRQAKVANETLETNLRWTPARLRAEVERHFGGSQLCVIANREPYVHNRKGGKIEVMFPASGLVTAVEPIVRACSGMWIAHGSGSADRETADRDGKLLVPPGAPEYVLKRVWLSKAEEQGYYYGFSNEGLWPLCHIAHARPHFEREDWAQYEKVNRRFAESFADEDLGERPVVLIQDYHFALLPGLLRERRPDAVTSLFWHIPWPNPEAFGICPWRKQLLEGMLGADLIGFHTQFHCNNFLDTVDRFLEARVDRESFSVTIRGHTCFVKPFPISVEWPTRFDLPVAEFAAEREGLLAELGLPEGTRVGIGVDRVDYTKGIIERFRSVERFLERHPEWVGKFVFVQIGAPSRTHIKRYQDLNSEVQEVADRINWKFAEAGAPPILLKLAHHNAPELYRYYRAADVCFVSSLHDGMNLVAKEYVSARSDEGGSLVLSTFTGAARELSDALLVNPYDVDECANTLRTALEMAPIERRARMARMRSIVADQNVYAWAGSFLQEIDRISRSSGTGAGRDGSRTLEA